jgi:hypothetical protein
MTHSRVYKRADELAQQLERFRHREMDGNAWALTEFKLLISDFLELLLPVVEKTAQTEGKRFSDRMGRQARKRQRLDDLTVKRAEKVRARFLKEFGEKGLQKYAGILIWRTAQQLEISDPALLGRLTGLPPRRVKKMLAEREEVERQCQEEGFLTKRPTRQTGLKTEPR